MKTPLFIGERYCMSLEELKEIIKQMVIERGSLYDDMLIIVADGLLEKWLNEGTKEEIALAESIKQYKDPRHALNKLCLDLDLPTAI